MKRILGLLAVMALAACGQKQGQSINDGTSTAGIIGGTAVSVMDPINHSTVQIVHPEFVKDENGQMVLDRLSTCTGTVVSSDIILSAGHCSNKDPRQLILIFSNKIPSNWQLFFSTISRNPAVRRVVAGVTAPNWVHLTQTTEKNWGDVSLLRFTGGLPASYVPAQLVPADAQLTTSDVVLAGFGETDGVQKTQATQLMKVTTKISDPNFSESEIQVDNVDGHGACHGDSGGPAYVTDLVGVTSRADEKTDPKAVCVGKTIYASVQYYLDWIASESKKLDADQSYGTVIAEPAGF